MANEITEFPTPIDPRITAKLIAEIKTDFDNLDSPAGMREFHNLVQDKLIKAIEQMHAQISATMFYVSNHDDRIEALEIGDDSQLLPEDAAPLIKYLKESLAVLTKMSVEVKVPDLQKLVKEGQAVLKFVESIVMAEEGDEEEDVDDDGDDGDDEPGVPVQ